MADVTREKLAFNTSLCRLKRVFGPEWPPRSTFEKWPASFSIYEEIAFKMPEKLHDAENALAFRSWMDKCLEKVFAQICFTLG